MDIIALGEQHFEPVGQVLDPVAGEAPRVLPAGHRIRGQRGGFN